MACSQCRRLTECHCPTNVPGITQGHSYRPYVRAYKHSQPIWEPRSIYPITSRCQLSRSRSAHRHQGVAHSAFCDFCRRDWEYCRCPYKEPIRDITLASRCSYCGYEVCQCRSIRSIVYHDKLKPVKQTEQMMRVQLFEASKKDKQYERARELYLDALDHDTSGLVSDEMLRLKASFADMQATQGKCEEAEDIIKNILRVDDLPISLERQCDEIQGRILCSRKRYDEAERLYRRLYDRASKDQWSLDMGDELCKVVSCQGDHDLAQLEQVKIWEKKRSSLGDNHPSTVKSGIAAVEYFKKLIMKLPAQDEFEKDRNKSRRQSLEQEVEDICGKIWMAGDRSKQDISTLKAGHEYGTYLSRRRNFDKAEEILTKVWRDRRIKLGETDKETLTSGIALCEAKYRQGRERCADAARDLESILALARSKQLYEEDDPLSVAAEAHLGVIYSRLGDQRKAEELCRRSMYKAMAKGGVTIPSPEFVRYALGRSLLSQGGVKKPEARQILEEVYQNWQRTQPDARDTLECGKLLGKPPLRWVGPHREPMTFTQELVIARRGNLNMAGKTDEEYYRAGLVRGKALLREKKLEKAEMVLADFWNLKTNDIKASMMRARCGDQYGRCLTKRGKYNSADRILREVRALKKMLYPGPPNEERHDTGRLIRKLPVVAQGARSYFSKTAN